MGYRVVLVEDDSAMREMVEDFLVSAGHSHVSFGLASDAFGALQSMEPQELRSIDAIVTDLNMPEMDGLEFVQRMKVFSPDIPVIIMTAYASIDSAIEATRRGAFSYISKPFKLGEFEVTLSRAAQLRELKKENLSLKASLKSEWKSGNLIGKSRGMRELFDLIQRVAEAQANVLITGESGTGKELVARAIHEAGSRKEGPFVAVNCTALPDSLLESELFGHMKGSFTGALQNKIGLFEEANGGTLFLDEIGDLNFNLQAKLLRVLQEKKVKPVGANREKEIDVRLVAATHKNLRTAIDEEQFREDLFYRLSVLPLHIPPLRQRKEDIPLLIEHFLAKYSALNNCQVKAMSDKALQKLIDHRWSGNVRELENLVERMVVLTRGDRIEEGDLPLLESQSAEDFFTSSTSDWPSLDELENRYIGLVLQKTGGHKEKASQILGVNRRTLYRKEKDLGNF